MVQKVGEMQSAVKAVFFDIGGTLRITRHDVGRDPEKVREMMELLGEKASIESFVEKIHKGEKKYRKWCKPNYVELNEEELLTRFLLTDYPKEFVRSNAVTLNQLWRDSKRKYVLPDMVDTLRTLSARGYKLGLISNTTSSVEGHRMLAELGLTELFSAVVLSAAFGRRKPHPSLFLEAARQAGVHPWECAYVGDRPSRDVIGAMQSGYSKTVLIHTEDYVLDEFDPDDFEPEKDTELILAPDHRITRLTQLLDILLEVKPEINVGKPSRPDYLYDAALSTMWGIDQTNPFEESFTAANSIGIARFELNHKVTANAFLQFDHNRHYISSVHDPCGAAITYDEQKAQDLLISSLDEDKRKQGVEIACQTISLARNLGSKSVVLHPGAIVCDRSKDDLLRQLYSQGKRSSPEYDQLKAEIIAQRKGVVGVHKEQVLKSLLEILKFNAHGKSIPLALENRHRYFDLPIPDELEDMLSLGDGKGFGVQYDIGHAVVLDELGLVDHEEWLKRFGSRVIGVHIHDVKGITDHLAPGLGQVNFKKIVAYLPEACLKTLEIRATASLGQIAAGLEVLVRDGLVNKIL
jgi:HAD superfamily hydrolase (TIGR01549 family)